MADSEKAKAEAEKQEDHVDQPEGQDVDQPDVTETAEPVPEDGVETQPEAETAVDDQPDPVEAEPIEPEVVEPEVVEEKTPISEPVSQTQVVVRKGGFFPMLIGGVLAASAGFVAGRGDFVPQEYLPEFLKSNSTDVTAQIDTQAQEIATLRATLEETVQSVTADATTGADLQQVVETLSGTVEGLQSNLSTVQQDLTDKIDAIAVAPAPTETVGQGADTAEVAALRALLEEQSQRIETLAAQAEAQMQSTEATVAQLEANAVTEAKQAEARSALGRIQAALQTGDGFAAALADLQAATDIEVPDAVVAAAETGVPSVAALSADFPAYARTALAVARSSSSGDEAATGGRLAAFIARQTGARSVEPREGSDPDAVLSRAEAAVRNGAFADAFAEIETLPEPARVELSDWLAQAQARVDAVTATDALADALKSN